MSVAKIIEISAESKESFDDAVRQGIRKAGETVENIKSAWVQDQEVRVENGRVTDYLVKLKVTFLLK